MYLSRHHFVADAKASEDVIGIQAGGQPIGPTFYKSEPDQFATGDDRGRTGNPCLAKAVLSQLSYVPEATQFRE